MEKNDEFKDWIKQNLQEETETIFFSEQARKKVSKAINKENKDALSLRKWWNRRISLPLVAVSFCLAGMLFLTALYTTTFFHVSPQEIARFETQPKIILHNGDIPFGALQHQFIASLEIDKGVGRP